MITTKDYLLAENYNIENGLIIKSFSYGLREVKSQLNKIRIQRQETIWFMTLRLLNK